MEISIIGLGSMGFNLALNLVSKGYKILAYDSNKNVINKIKSKPNANIKLFTSIKGLCSNSSKQKLILISLPHDVIDKCIDELILYLNKDDIIADLGNSFFLDTRKRFQKVQENHFHFLGIGVSGGPNGAKEGPSIMVGGSKTAWKKIKNIFIDISAKKDNIPACGFFGNPGNGHLIKMVHNGIEYAFMQTLSEVYMILANLFNLKNTEQNIVFSKLSNTNIGCYLLDTTSKVISKKKKKSFYLDIVNNEIDYNGTGNWTINTALSYQVSIPSIYAAVSTRLLSGDFQIKAKGKKSSAIALKLNENDIHDIVLFSFSCAMFQGLSILLKANQKEKLKIDLNEVFKAWSAGCILQGKFLNLFRYEFLKTRKLDYNFLFNFISKKTKGNLLKTRKLISFSNENKTPTPVISSSLNYYDSVFSTHKIGEITQLQRNYFGKHQLKTNNGKKMISPKWT